MFEKIKEQMGFIDVPVKIELRNGRSIQGLLIDYLAGQNINEWKFISYSNLSKYKESENPKYFEPLIIENISGVDMSVR